MNPFTLTLLPSGHAYPAGQLRAAAIPPDLAPHERQALTFCRQWEEGQETFVLQTSGSTGMPKPIVLTRAQMAASARMTGKVLGLEPGDRALVSLNTQYIGGLMMLVRGMELGLQLVVTEPASLPLAGLGPDAHLDFFSFVPLQLQHTLEKDPTKLDLLNGAKAILVGGAPVAAALEEMLQSIAAPLYQTYGMTETVSHVALRRLNGPGRQAHYTLLEGVKMTADERRCAIIDPNLPGLAPVVTNDVVELLTPSTFRWLGRADNMINSGGVKVQAEKIEALVEKMFERLHLKNRFLVAGLPHPELGESVALLVEGPPLPNQTEAHLTHFLQHSLPKYERPKSIRYVPSFAETPTGKIDKRLTLTLSKS
ncbi:MAG: O-succinylbenzoic acid--CoA ligase [uncultured Cytophagales bacterium]|uniref:O-succinylbenzoic acid--CoA ligase n=1 Tax=uncultured Cytophagales bacterium TaxID=158755 RepID=A0A6J4IBD6_9SPHI|nr:MAG: O-succinylbenzoic acid--CoA ligase [uncultured Cytophagales bacterium]